ncbi:helix-turn-helix domain-containing protein [Flavobacterium sp.]|uniref:helix-turn-helix domain-containing protein n=1 Tax=Flavobacterium sp. TaxID=239 RepID=UPI003B9B77F5
MNFLPSTSFIRSLHKAFLIVLICSSTLLGHAQELTEEENKQTRRIQELLVTAPEKAKEEAKKLSQSASPFARYCGQYYTANYYYVKSNYDESKKILTALLKEIDRNPSLSKQKNYQDLMGMCVNKLFYLYKNVGAYNQALVLMTTYKDKIPNDRYEQQLGILKIAMGEYKEGIALLKNDLRAFKDVDLGVAERKEMHNKLVADRYNEIGEAYQKYYVSNQQNKHLDSANVYFQKAAKIMLDEPSQADFTRALLNMHQAKSAALKGDYQTALRFYQRRDAYPEINKNLRTVQIFDLGMADCYFHLKQPDSSIYYAKAFVRNYQQTKVSKENLLLAYSLLSKSYSEKKNTEQAYNYAQKSLALIEELDRIKSKSVDFLHNYTVSTIRKEADSILNRQFTFLGIMIGLVLALGIVFWMFYRYSKKQKDKHKRFLSIIQRLKEPKPIEPITTISITEDSSTKIMDDELIDKIKTGLEKLERSETFLKSEFKLAFVAKKLNTNTAYLSQYLNQVLGKSFSDYTQELRINFVLRKLSNSPQFRNFTLQAIAEEVGYKDATTFVKVFKKHTGLSPNYYIQHLQEKDL